MAEKDDFKFYVIGAGFSRTGTLSMKVALEKLLPGKCMHFQSVFYEGDLNEILHDVLEQTSTDESFRNYFRKYNIVAGVDIPFIYNYKRAIKLFPEAKVVLTVREPSAWIKSMQQTICPILLNREYARLPISFLAYWSSAVKRFFTYALDHRIFQNAAQSIKIGKGEEYFNDWVEDVKNTVPPERLLIFSVKEGWEPLCKFLDLPIPDEPFPHENDTLTFKRDINILRAKGWLGIIVMSTLPIVFGYGAARLFNFTMKNEMNDFLWKENVIETMSYKSYYVMNFKKR